MLNFDRRTPSGSERPVARIGASGASNRAQDLKALCESKRSDAKAMPKRPMHRAFASIMKNIV